MQQEARALADAMRAECLGVRVGRLHRLVSRAFEDALRPLALTLPQLEVLSTLTVIGGPVRPSELADLAAVERSTMSRNLALLEGRGLVGPVDRSATGRSLTVAITADGTRLLASADRAWRSAQDEVLASLGPAAPAVVEQWVGRLNTPG